MDRVDLEGYLAQGMSLERIGKLVGRDASTVSYWVGKFGLSAVHAGRAAPRGGIEKQTLERFVERGLSMCAMARELGVSLSTVSHWMKRHELRSTAYVRSTDQAEKPSELERVCKRHGATRFVLTSPGQYRCARCRSEHVSARRRRVKQVLVEEAGGRCTLCGYDRCIRALHFHHVDPSTKLFTVSHGGVTASIARARDEAAKCVLLCSNCHADVESGRVEVSRGKPPD